MGGLRRRPAWARTLPPPRLVLVLVALISGLSACQATVRVGIDTRPDGSGTVTVSARLDKEAAASVPNLAAQLRTSDLVQAGWKVVGPDPVPGGDAMVTASKTFRNPAEASTAVAEVSGPTGPFHDLTIVTKRSLFETRTSFRGTVDLTCGLHCFADPQLQQQLGGTPDLGIDPAKLQADAGVILDRLFKFEVAVRLPGSVLASNAPAQAGNGAQWQPKLGDKAMLLASARAWNVGHIAEAVLAGLILLTILVTVAARHARRGRGSRRRS